MSTTTPPGHLTAPAAWALRLAGLSALVNGVGFGAFDIPATWHLAHDHHVWYSLGNPTYANGPFEAHGITVTVPVLLAFLGSCLVLAIGGALLLVPRTTGVIVTLAGIASCAPFWWGFDLPFAWFNVMTVLILLAMAWAAQMHTRTGRASRRGSELWRPHHRQPARGDDGGRRHGRVTSTPARSMGGRRFGRPARRRGGAVRSVGVDEPGMSDSAILERLDDGARQAAARIGLPMLAAGSRCCSGLPPGCGGCWTGCPAATRSHTRSCRRRRCSAG